MVNPLFVERGFKRLAIALYAVAYLTLIGYVLARCYRVSLATPVVVVEHVAEWGNFPDFAFCSFRKMNATFSHYVFQSDGVLNSDGVTVYVTKTGKRSVDDCVIFRTSVAKPAEDNKLSWFKIRLYFSTSGEPRSIPNHKGEYVNAILLSALEPNTIKGIGDLAFMTPRDVENETHENHDVQLHKERVDYNGNGLGTERYKATTHRISLLTKIKASDGAILLSDTQYEEGARKPNSGENPTKMVQAFIAAKAPLGEPLEVKVFRYKSKREEYLNIVLGASGQIGLIFCFMAYMFPKKYRGNNITATAEIRTLRGFQDRELVDTAVTCEEVGFNSFGSLRAAQLRTARGVEMPRRDADDSRT